MITRRRFHVWAGLGCWILGLLGAGTVQAGAGPDPAISMKLAVVDSLLDAGDAATAAGRARKLWERFADDPLYGGQIAGRLGLALVRSGKPGQGVPLLEDAINSWPKDADLHRNLAFALKALGRRGRALAEYQTAAGLAPADFRMHLEYGQALLEFRSFPRAERELDQAWKLCDGCPDADQALANLYLQQGDFRLAALHLGRLWAVHPTPGVRLLYATSLARSDQANRAEALLDSVPVSALHADEWRLLVQMEKDDPDLGVRWSSRAVSLAAGDGSGQLPLAPLMADAPFWAVAGANLQSAGRPEEALQALDLALAVAPGNVVYLRNKVAILQELGREDEAARLWNKVLSLDPGQKPHEGSSP